jgi:hypothetical protein
MPRFAREHSRFAYRSAARRLDERAGHAQPSSSAARAQPLVRGSMPGRLGQRLGRGRRKEAGRRARRLREWRIPQSFESPTPRESWLTAFAAAVRSRLRRVVQERKFADGELRGFSDRGWGTVHPRSPVPPVFAFRERGHQAAFPYRSWRSPASAGWRRREWGDLLIAWAREGSAT